MTTDKQRTITLTDRRVSALEQIARLGRCSRHVAEIVEREGESSMAARCDLSRALRAAKGGDVALLRVLVRTVARREGEPRSLELAEDRARRDWQREVQS